MSLQLHKAHVAFYTSTADIDKCVLKYYAEESKQAKAKRAWAEYTILKAWWEKHGFSSLGYGVWCDVVEPRGIVVGGAFHISQDKQRLIAMIDDYKETFLPDYDDDNIWWGEGEEPIEGYALEHVWVEYTPHLTVIDSGVTRLGSTRRHLDLKIDAAVSNDFYMKGGEDGLPF